MTNELRAAAERLLIEGETLGGSGSPYWDESVPRIQFDLIAIADSWLAEHPADGDTPIDESWLRSVGFEQPSHNPQCPFIFSPPSISDTGLRLSFYFDSGDHPNEIALDCDDGFGGTEYKCAPCRSRGDLRLLCRALHVPLKEGGA